ncbi:hypothetical protein LUCX_43 [Xanthomonas phage vB_XciM_LucasX]|nr:hypothetical protein LUCX_43 [Xanthomonas phage vB_XciM_LucasX]
MKQRPFRTNTDWVVSSEHDFTPRGVEEEVHFALAQYLIHRDPELASLQYHLGLPIILRMEIGKRTIHLRVYDKNKLLNNPDRLASRRAEPDSALFLEFGPLDSPVPTISKLPLEYRLDAQSQVPMMYAVRRMSNDQVLQLNDIQAKLLRGLPSIAAFPSPPLGVVAA